MRRISKSTSDSPKIVLFSAAHSMDEVRIFVKEARSLARAGFDVTYIARGDIDDVVDGVRRVGVPRSKRGGRLARILLDPFRVAKKVWAEDADYYQFHDPSMIPVAYMFKLLGKRVGYDAHEDVRADILSKHYLPRSTRSFVSTIVGLLESFTIQRFDVVIAATPRIAETLHTNHTYVVTNFPVSEEISDVASSGTRDSETVLYVGSIEYIRCIREMVLAIGIVNETRPAQFVLIGEISGSILSILETLHGWEYVESMGRRTRDEVQQHMAKATCGLCLFYPEPNHVEAVPNKIFEYMAAGVPVVASDFPYWHQFVTDVGSGVLVDAMNPRAIADGILQILGDPDSAAQMGQAGLKAVRDRFNWDHEAAKLVDIIRNVTSHEG